MSVDDVVQDVALQFTSLEEAPDNWCASVRRATENRLIALARQLARRPQSALTRLLAERAERVMGQSAGVIARRQLADALGGLSERDRQALAAHLLGQTHSEIAKQLGYASAAVVASTVHRAVRKISAAMPELRFDLEPQRVYRER